MAASTVIVKQQPSEPLAAGLLCSILEISHPECLIKIKIGDRLIDVREVRHVTTEPGAPVCKVLVPVDFIIETK